MRLLVKCFEFSQEALDFALCPGSESRLHHGARQEVGNDSPDELHEVAVDLVLPLQIEHRKFVVSVELVELFGALLKFLLFKVLPLEVTAQLFQVNFLFPQLTKSRVRLSAPRVHAALRIEPRLFVVLLVEDRA